MEQKNLSTINLSRKQLKDVEEFCKLNKIENVEEFLVKCFVEGYEIEKYGLLQNSGGSREKWVEKEVIVEKRVEVPVEVIIEKPIIEYVEVEKEVIKEVIVEKVVEKLIEVIKEIPVEKIVIQEVIKEIPVEVKVEKKVYITDDEAVKQLGGKITKLEEEESQLLSKIQQLETSFDTQRSEYIRKISELESRPPTVVEKTTVDLSKQKALEETIQKLRGELQLKNKEIQDLSDTIKEIQTNGGVRGVLLDGSNLNRTINRR
jgi:hypothetical protein